MNAKIGKGVEMMMLFFVVFSEKMPGAGGRTSYKGNKNHHSASEATKYQKGVHYIGVKVFNMLPFYIEAEGDNPKKFKAVLQKHLYENSFYSLNEYFELHS